MVLNDSVDLALEVLAEVIGGHHVNAHGSTVREGRTAVKERAGRGLQPPSSATTWRRFYALELDVEEVLSPVVLSRKDWESSLYRAMPFHRNVDRDGVIL